MKVKALNSATVIAWLSLIGLCLIFSSNVQLESAWRLVAVSMSCVVACAAYRQIAEKKNFRVRDFIKALLTLCSAIGLMLAITLVMMEPYNPVYGLIFIVFFLILLSSIFTILFWRN